MHYGSFGRLAAVAVAVVVMALGAVVAVPSNLALALEEAPFGDKVSERILNYNRATPFVATAGLLYEGGVAEAKALGFAVIVDLRAPEEGIEAERQTAEQVGITYINIPVSTKLPTDAQVAQLASVIEDAANLPVLVHCVSANRAGTIWTLYRISKGIDPETAIEEGRTLGMKPSREAAVREKFGLAALAR
jgi:uncharacterized protein (TIGR01244 family)